MISLNKLLLILIIVLLFPINTYSKSIDPETRVIINGDVSSDYGELSKTSYGKLTALEFGSKKEAKQAYKKIVKYHPDAFIDKPVYPDGNVISEGSDLGIINAMTYNNFGNKKVTVAIVDSGLTAKNRIFKGRVISKKSVNVVNRSHSYKDKINHGTPIAGIIAACTPKNVEMMPINIYDNDKEASTVMLIKGIDYAIKNGADIINLSLSYDECVDTIPQIEELLKKAYDNNIIIVASAGNYNTNKVRYPASSKYTISVGSYDVANGYKSFFSSYGEKLDFVCPGDFVYSVDNKGKVTRFVGTSFSSPHMVACVALLKLVDKNITFKQVYNALRVKAKDRGKKGWDKYHGWGSPRINYSVNYLFRKQLRSMKKYNKLPVNFYIKYTKKYIKIYRKKDNCLFIKKNKKNKKATGGLDPN